MTEAENMPGCSGLQCVLVALWIIASSGDPVGWVSLGLFTFKSQGIVRKLNRPSGAHVNVNSRGREVHSVTHRNLKTQVIQNSVLYWGYMIKCYFIVTSFVSECVFVAVQFLSNATIFKYPTATSEWWNYFTLLTRLVTTTKEKIFNQVGFV